VEQEPWRKGAKKKDSQGGAGEIKNWGGNGGIGSEEYGKWKVHSLCPQPHPPPLLPQI